MNVIIVNCFETYEQRVDLLDEVLIKEGHSVRVFASDFCHIEKKTRSSPKKDYVFFHAEPYFRNFSCRRLRSHKKIAEDIFDYMENNVSDVDLLWVLVPPNSLVKCAAAYKNRHNVKIIFDLIDLWPETMPIKYFKNVFPLTVWKDLRDKYIRSADTVVTECALYRKKTEAVIQGLRTETLYLAKPCFPYIPDVKLPVGKISLCYLGSVNNIIDIVSISRIVAEARRKKEVVFHIIGDGNHRNDLIESCRAAGAEVVFHGIIYDREQKQRIFDGCHYGLNIMKPYVCVGLTMKSIDYMESGLPLINNIQGDTWEIVDKNKIGINLSDDDTDIFNNDYDMSMRLRARSFFEDNLTYAQFEKKVLGILQCGSV